ncbi:MAG: AraC family transcriptional regulator [Bacteroidaceae bacterium]
MIKRKDGFSGQRALVLPPPVVKELEQDPISAILHITDIGYYPKAKHHYRVRTEPIAQFVFIYCVEGRGWYRVGDETFEVKANEYFILPAGVPHAYASDEKELWTIYWIHFKGKLASYFAKQCLSPQTVTPNVHSRISNRIDLFEEIFRTLEMGYSHENLLYSSSAFYHYLGTLRYLQQYRNALPCTTESNDIITAAIHFMRENIEKKLSLNTIAQHIGYSPSHFSVLFHKRTGYAPLAYLNQLKIQQACHLLDFTDMKVNQVCYKIGIEDPYYFSRLFRKTMGVSPSKYKEQKKG